MMLTPPLYSTADCAGATFRESIDMGFFEGSVSEARQLAYSLRPDFNGDDYNLLTKCVLRVHRLAAHLCGLAHSFDHL